MKLSVIMPCYHGKEYLRHSIEELNGKLSSFIKDYEIIVVIDGNDDGSLEYARKLERIFKKLIVVGYEKNKGKGYALRFGLEHARGNYIAFLDADMDYDPIALKWFLEEIKYYDAVIGNRRDKNSVFDYGSRLRVILSKLFNLYVNLLFPKLKIKDTQAGIKLFRNDVIKRVFQVMSYYKCERFAYDVLLLYTLKALNYSIKESRCIFHHKITTIRKIKLIKVIFSMAIDILKLRIRLWLNPIRKLKLNEIDHNL